jgi:hypothetical protein
MSISPSYSDPFVMDNVNPSTVTVTHIGGPAVAFVVFFKELDSLSTSVRVGNDSTAPYTISLTATDVPTNGLLTIKAVVVATSGIFTQLKLPVQHPG